MGFIDNARALFTRPVSLLSAAAVATASVAPPAPVIPTKVDAPRPPTKETGTDGIANFAGQVRYEPIEELRGQSAYGRSGGNEWGFWEDLSAANSFVADALDFVCAPVANARVDVKPPPPGLVPDALATKMTDYVKWNLTEKLKLRTYAAIAARGFLKSGFSIFEDVYAPTEDGPWKGHWHLRTLAERLPLSLSPNPWVASEDGSTLKGIRQLGFRGTRSVNVELPAEKLLLFIWQRQGNNWQGRSAFRAVQYIAGHVMPMLLKLIGVTLQREGAGIPIMEAVDKTSTLTPEQREQASELMANLVFHESAHAILPAGWQLKWVFSGSSNKGHVLEVWRELGTVVRAQLGAQQLGLGTSNTGSRSVGETHASFSSFKPREVLGLIESVFNGDDGEVFTGLVPRMCRFNWGAQPAYPRVTFTLERPEMPITELSTAAASLKSAGLLTPTAKDENVIREKLALPPITDKERDEAKEKAAALAPQLQPGFGSPPEPGGDVPERPKGKPLQASAQRGSWAPWRTLRASEMRTDWGALDRYFVAQREEFDRRAGKVVMAMLATVAPAIERAMADGVVKPAEVAELPLDTKRLTAMIRAYLFEVRKAGQVSVQSELGKLRAAAEDEQGDEREDEKQQARDDAEEVIDAQADALQRRMVNRLRGEIEREAIDTNRTGGDAGDVVSRVVSRQMDTGAFRSDAGYVTTKAFNVGRDEAARIMGGIAEVEYSAILDSATCLPCYRDDGRTADFGSAEHDAMVPPNRDCAGEDKCRCVLVMIPARGDA